MNSEPAARSGGRFAGRAALVTGAGSGIGQAIAIALAREGARVACTDIVEAAAQRTLAMIEAEGWSSLSMACS